MNRLRVAFRARLDLDGIRDHIRQTSLAAADRQIDLLFEKFSLLASQPLMGQPRDDLRPGLRVFSAGNYAILFYALPDGIEVAGVVHAARDVEAMFRRGER